MSSDFSLPLFPELETFVEKTCFVSGTVSKVLHVNADNGFMILEVLFQDGSSGILKGKGDPIIVGDEVSSKGDWVVDAKWGRHFKAKFIQTAVADTAKGILRYITLGNVPGLGQKTADRLYSFFGESLPSVIDKPATLVACGLNDVKARQLSASWANRNRHGRVLSVLQSHGLGPVLAQRVIDYYGNDTLRVVVKTPYRLASEVNGIGFKKADKIAISQGLSLDTPERICAGIRYQLEVFAKEGHCAATRMMLRTETAKMLILEESLVEKQIDFLLLQGDLVEEFSAGRSVLYSKSVRECEEEIASLLVSRLAKTVLPTDIETIVLSVRQKLGLPALHESQLKAVILAIENHICVVTGNPGTGKTSTVSTVMATLSELSPEILIALAAPTGRAAQRLTESTGYPASTLHRMLEWSPEKRGFLKDKDNPLLVDVLVIDESSMLDIWMMRDMLRALPDHARLIIVGDVDQLASVGQGQVLSDLISSQVIPTARLTHIFRQGPGSNIAIASQKINSGVIPPVSSPTRKNDMWGVFVETPEEIHEKLKSLALTVLPKIGIDPLKDLQILSPGHQKETGTLRLNQLMQELLNPLQVGQKEILHKDRFFRIKDRVIQVVNNYDMDVFNGDIGRIVDISTDDDFSITVDFEGKEIVYDRKMFDELQHAYCISIHKSQGSEFPVVVVVLSTQHYVMLKKNLTYTGVSRAKKLCCILGSRKALSISVKSGGTSRITGLAKRLMEHHQKRLILTDSGEDSFDESCF